MKTSLTKGLDAVTASEVESEFNASGMLRRRLIEVLESKQAAMLKKRRSEFSYDSPNWSLMQADAVGYEKALEEVISLLK